MTVDLTVNGDAGADQFTLLKVGSTVDIFQNTPTTGTPVQSFTATDADPILINGNGGNDGVTVDYSGGDPIPGGLTIDATAGGSASPTLVVQGVAAGTSAAPVFTLSSTSLQVSNTAVDDTIAFSGITNFNLFPDTGTGSLTVTGGTFTFGQDLGANGTGVNLDVQSGATVAFGVTQHLDAATVESGGTLDMLPAGGQVLDTNTLSDSGVIDLANNDLIVNTPAGSSTSTIVSDVAAGVTASATQGIIFSSTASTDSLTIGVVPNADLPTAITTLDGQSVSSTAVIAKYALSGDAFLTGTVGSAQLGAVLQHFGFNMAGNPDRWLDGDFSYDTTIGATDLGDVTQNFGVSDTPTVTSVTAGTAFTLDFPTPPTGTAIRWDVSWGDGTFNSYAGSAASASHVYVDAGLNSVQFTATVFIPGTTGYYTGTTPDSYGVYTAPAQTVAVTTTGVTATAVTLTASSATDLFAITSNMSGGTIITQNGTTIESADTDSILSLTITGSPALVSLDFSDGDPIPLAGLYSNAGQIELSGTHGSDPLVTDGSSTILGSDLIRFSTSTRIVDNLDDASGIIAIRGTSLVSLPFNGSTPQPATVLPGATVIVNGNTTLSSLTVDPGGTFRMAESGASLLTVGSLTLEAPDTAGDNGGVLDLSDNDMIARSTSASAIETFLAAGYDGGLWEGASELTGPQPATILSSTATAGADPNLVHALGYEQVGAAAGDWSASNVFDGTSVSSGDTVVKYTLYGDADLDGTVDSTDESAANAGYLAGLTGWGNGDFTYDGSGSSSSLSPLEISEAFQNGIALLGAAGFSTSPSPVTVTVNRGAGVPATVSGPIALNNAPPATPPDTASVPKVVLVNPNNGPNGTTFAPTGINVTDGTVTKGPKDVNGNDTYSFTISVNSDVQAGTYYVCVELFNHGTSVGTTNVTLVVN